MALFLIRRILLGFLSLFFITVVTFFIIQMPPGDYVDQWMQNMFLTHISQMSPVGVS